MLRISNGQPATVRRFGNRLNTGETVAFLPDEDEVDRMGAGNE